MEEYGKEHKITMTDEAVKEKIEEASRHKIHIAKSKSGVVVNGIDDMSVHFSHCCSPVPGDEIVGFVTRGRGLSIHRTDCVNMLNLSDMERSRLVNVEWEDEVTEEESGQYLAEIKIYANDRTGLLMEISRIFTEDDLDVRSLNVRTSKQGTATIEAGFIVSSRDQLDTVIKKMRQVEGVLDIERTSG